MNSSIQTIPLLHLAMAFLPALLVLGVMFKWSLRAQTGVYAMGRMLLQLMLIGYVLTYIFESEKAGMVILVLAVMVFFSSWIALRMVKVRRRILYPYALASILLGGLPVLALVTQGVLQLHPWFLPQYVIPLAGMIFANSMNSVSLAAERISAELARNVAYEQARNEAFQAALIPIMNSLFAVGLVSIPGMMTGQILSGVSPLIAARYQIMVMCMIFGSTGISAAAFMVLAKPCFLSEAE